MNGKKGSSVKWSAMILLSALFVSPLVGFAAGSALPAKLTPKDTYSLSEKLKRAFRACSPLRPHPSLSVSIENQTGEEIDETRLNDLLRSMLEGKTDRFPESEKPELAVRAVLTANEKKVASVYRTEYRLTALLFRDSQLLCESSAKLKKLARASRSGGN